MFRPALRTFTRRAAPALRPSVTRCFASASGPAFNWEDPLNATALLTDEELAIAETAERYCQERMAPRVLGMFTIDPYVTAETKTQS
jgi:glutaryl-CoA dehydrogenase